MTDNARQTEAILFTLIVLLATVLRLAGGGQALPGFSAEEMAQFQNAQAVLSGDFSLTVFAGDTLSSPIFSGITALVMAIFGQDPVILRVVNAVFGIAGVVLVYLWVRVATQNRWLALATMAGLAVNPWTVSTSHLGLPVNVLPVFYMAAALAMRRGIRVEEDIEDDFLPLRYRPRAYVQAWYWFVLSGLFLGLSMYTHGVSWLMWLSFPAFFIFLTLDQPRVLRRTWLGLAIILGVAAVIAFPGAWQVSQSASPRAFFQSFVSFNPLCLDAMCNFQEMLRMRLGVIATKGSALWLYNLPGRPLLGPLMALLFFLGASVAVTSLIYPYRPARRGRRTYDDTFRITSANAFMLITLVVGLVPVVLGGVRQSPVLAVGVQPALFYFPALAVVWSETWMRRHAGDQGSTALWVTYGILILVVALIAAHMFFDVWMGSEAVRELYSLTPGEWSLP